MLLLLQFLLSAKGDGTVNSPILSICIPTYNRGNELYEKINKILRCASNDFDIIVLDNCSPDGTYEKLAQIQDSRLKLFQNESNIGGILNPLKAVTYSDGLYSLMMLDKDELSAEHLEAFISFLRTVNVSHGFCKLDLDDTSGAENSFFKTGTESVINTAFLSLHPTGMFWKTELYKASKEVAAIFVNPVIFGFYFELVNCELSVTSDLDSAIYNNTLVYMAKYCEENKNVFTLSYNKKNCYFLPKMRYETFKRYINFAVSCGCNDLTDGYKIFAECFGHCIGNILWSRKFKYNKYIMLHYNIQKKDINIINSVFYIFVFILWYFSFLNKEKLSFKMKTFGYLFKKILNKHTDKEISEAADE